jgi:Domain of unknown function (DUF4387)
VLPCRDRYGRRVKLGALATTLTSKNAGNFHLTFDISFADEATYARVRDSGALTPFAIARAFGVGEHDVVGVIPFDPGRAIKVNINRERPSGDPGETDVFGAQQYTPLLDLEIPDQAV